MCGIAGVYRINKNSAPLQVWHIEQLLLDNQKRGVDATGVAVQYKDGRIRVTKDNDPAWRFVQSRRWRDFLDENATATGTWHEDIVCVLAHTRAATKGSAYKMENNHPVIADGTVIIHNGVIWNDDMLFDRMKLKRPAEVDSSIIAAILEEYGLGEEGVKVLNQMNGFAAIAALKTDSPGKLLLTRSGSPLVTGVWDNTQQLVFSSRPEGLHLCNREYFRKYGIDFHRKRLDFGLTPMEMNTAHLWEQDRGISWHGKFETTNQVHRASYACFGAFASKAQDNRVKENREKVNAGKGVQSVPVGKITAVRCRNQSCRKVCKLKAEQRSLPLWKLQCNACKTILADVPAV